MGLLAREGFDKIINKEVFMGNERVTDLPTVTSASLTDIIYAVQGYTSPSNLGLSVQETLQQVFNLMLAQTILNYAGNPNGHVAGNTYQLLWDSSDAVMYVCTTSGTSSTAVWTQVSSSASGIVNAAHGGTGVASPTAHTLPVAEGASNFNFLGPLTNGQLLIGSTGVDPVPGAITGSGGISVSLSAGGINISGAAGGLSWTDVAGTSQTMVAENGYTANNAGLVTLALPATAAYGTGLSVIGKGVGGWIIAQNAGQNIQVGSVSSTVGAGGTVASTNRYDSIDLVCTTANTTWTVLGGVQGNLTIV
jgi:hypothetical protein